MGTFSRSFARACSYKTVTISPCSGSRIRRRNLAYRLCYFLLLGRNPISRPSGIASLYRSCDAYLCRRELSLYWCPPSNLTKADGLDRLTFLLIIPRPLADNRFRPISVTQRVFRIRI